MNKQLKILHWPTSYPDADRGQPYNAIFVEEHIKSTLTLVNNRVLFISPESTTTQKWHEKIDRIENGIKVTRFYFNRALNIQFLNIYIRCILFRYFLRIILVEKFYPNIIHIHFFPAGEWAAFFAKLFRIKTIVTEHWTALIGYPVISSKRFDNARHVYEKASFVLPVSTHLGKGILENTSANISQKMEIIHNCVDISLFHLSSSHFTSTNRIISVARLEEQKDIPTMLKAFQLVKQKIPNATLRIIGGGNSSPFIDLSKKLDIVNHVEFLGAKPKSFIAQQMAESNLFILSSISENSPCVIGEAQCCGLPIVATDVGGVKELILSGAVVPPQQPERLASEIIKQLRQPFDRISLIQQAAKKFSSDAIGQQLVNIYKKACAE